VLAYGGGVLAGALMGLVSWQARRRMDDPMLEAIAMLVTPFAAVEAVEAVTLADSARGEDGFGSSGVA